MTHGKRIRGDISVPDTPAITRAIDYARVALCGEARTIKGAPHDEEVVAVASLHDLGLTKSTTALFDHSTRTANR